MKSRSMCLLRFTCAACFFCMLATAHCAPSSVRASIEDFKQGIKKQHQVLAVQHRLLDQLQPLLKKKNDTQRPATTRPHRAPAESSAREPRVHMIDDSHTVGGPNRLFYIEDLLSPAEIQLMMKGACRIAALYDSNFVRNSATTSQVQAEIQKTVALRRCKAQIHGITNYAGG